MDGWPMGELMTGKGEGRPLMGEPRVLMGEWRWPGLELTAEGLSSGGWRGWPPIPRWPVEEFRGDDESWPEESVGQKLRNVWSYYIGWRLNTEFKTAFVFQVLHPFTHLFTLSFVEILYRVVVLTVYTVDFRKGVLTKHRGSTWLILYFYSTPTRPWPKCKQFQSSYARGRSSARRVSGKADVRANIVLKHQPHAGLFSHTLCERHLCVKKVSLEVWEILLTKKIHSGNGFVSLEHGHDVFVWCLRNLVPQPY